jgi:general secretion pathway protein G
MTLRNNQSLIGKAAEAGFTLIEMMIVITIIATIATLVGLNVTKKLDKARIDSTKIQIKQLGVALEDYRRICGQYPTTDQSLDALVTKPTSGRECKNWDQSMQKLPQDAWGNPFTYASDGNKFVVKSLGADNAEGGEGVNADISSDDI